MKPPDSGVFIGEVPLRMPVLFPIKGNYVSLTVAREERFCCLSVLREPRPVACLRIFQYFGIRKMHLFQQSRNVTQNLFLLVISRATGLVDWLRHYAAKRKVAGSILHEVIGFFQFT
jgi:hypothetical protein